MVFADQNAVGQIAPASAAASLLGRAEAQLPDSSIAVYPVHLFLPDSTSQSREILIYIDSAVSRPAGHAPSERGEMTGWERALEARFQENAFQLRPSDLEYFLSDLEEVLRTSLQEEWASRADWKQDTDGFVLSRLAAEWVKQMNYLHPSRLVGLRKSLDDYRALQKRCALRELEVEGGDSPLGSGGWRVLLWFETILGLPIALYGLVNHCVILLVLFLAGTFKRNSSRSRFDKLDHSRRGDAGVLHSPNLPRGSQMGQSGGGILCSQSADIGWISVAIRGTGAAASAPAVYLAHHSCTETKDPALAAGVAP